MDTSEIVARLCRAALRQRFPLGAVRVQKLVYLIECEYFRWNQVRLTNERWIYYHYGPWSPTLHDVLLSEFQIEPEVAADGREFHATRYDERDFDRLPERFSDFEVQGIFEQVVERWLTSPIDQLLNYVYFRTPPMQDVERGQPLDFTTIPPARGERDPIDVFALAAKNRKRSDTVKRALATWREAVRVSPAPTLPWDAAADEAVREMDHREHTPSVAGEIIITGDDVRRLPGEAG